MTKRTIDIIDGYIAKNIKYQRNRRGISTEELAKVLEVTFQQIQKYEKIQNRISATNLFKLATFFNIDINKFFEGYHPNIQHNKIIKVDENICILAKLFNVDIQDVYKFLKIFKEFIEENENKDKPY